MVKTSINTYFYRYFNLRFLVRLCDISKEENHWHCIYQLLLVLST